jgi:hypothetical protein
MFGFLKSLFVNRSSSQKRTAIRAARRKLQRRAMRMEFPEGRSMFAVEAHFTTALHDVVEINGTDGDDYVTVQIDYRGAGVTDDQLVVMDHNKEIARFDIINQDYLEYPNNPPQIWGVDFHGKKGND